MAMGAESSSTPCRACLRPINDRYIMRVGDTSYHETCLVCSVCSIHLSSTCYTRDCKLFCRIDYESHESLNLSNPSSCDTTITQTPANKLVEMVEIETVEWLVRREQRRLFGKKCLGCSESVSPSELVMRAVDSVFHLRCFLCVVCGGRLQKGDQYVVKQGQLFCRPDYEKEVEMFQSNSQVAEEIIMTRPTDGRRGPKRPRTILTTQQRRAFKASFEISPKPCRKVREGLAKDTGLSVRIVQVWFQNQRAKMKKIQKKARLESKSNASNGNNSSEGDSTDDKKEKIKDDEPNCYFGDSCSDTEGVQDLRSNMGEYLPIKEECVEKEERAFYRSILSQPHGSHFTQSPDRLRTTKMEADALLSSIENYRGAGGGGIRILQGVPPHVCPPLYGLEAPVTPTSLGNSNPIDRLYSMQSSYFCSEQISE